MVALVTDVVTNDRDPAPHLVLAATARQGPDRQPRLIWPGLPKKGGCIRLVAGRGDHPGPVHRRGDRDRIQRRARLRLGLGDRSTPTTSRNFPVLAGIDALTIVADHDKRTRRRRAGNDAAQACTNRWVENGIEVLVWQAQAEEQDFNDWANHED